MRTDSAPLDKTAVLFGLIRIGIAVWNGEKFTNVGTLFQDDVATAYVHVAPEDRHDGQLVVVMRDLEGGVVWRVWSMRAE